MEAGPKTDAANGTKKGPPALKRKKSYLTKRLLFDENKKRFYEFIKTAVLKSHKAQFPISCFRPWHRRAT